MKRLNICLIIFALFLLVLSACASNQIDTGGSESPNGDVPSELQFEPLEFSSIGELSRVLNDIAEDRQSEFTQEFAQQIELYDIKSMSCIFVPTITSNKAELDVIRVKDNYVAFFYTLNNDYDTPSKDSRETAVREQQNSIVITWSRDEAGEALLRNTIDQQSLVASSGNDGVYYSDVYWPDDPDTILGKQSFWLQEGYMFMSYVPISEIDDTSIVIRKVAIEELDGVSTVSGR